MPQTDEIQEIEFEEIEEAGDDNEEIVTKLYETQKLKQGMDSTPDYDPKTFQEQLAFYSDDLYASIDNSWQRFPNSSNVLTKDNTTSFTPDADYEPATKKYVDDEIDSGINTEFKMDFTNDDVETIPAHKVVSIKSDGDMLYADAALAASYFNYLGFTEEETTKTNDGTVRVLGIKDNLSGLTPGSDYYLQDGANTLDQEQATTDSTESMLQNITYWQSFTTGSVNNIYQVALYMGGGSPSTDTFTLTIYEGEGTGGTTVTSKTFSPAVGTIGWNVITLSDVITISPSTQYTIAIVTTGTLTNTWYRSDTNVYANGKSSVNDNYDFAFRTYERTGRGEIGTSAGSNSVLVGKALSTTKLLITR